MRVLLVEDDSATAQSIELMLKSESFNVYTTDRGEEAIDLGKLYDYDMIILDINLPDMSGYEVLRTLRVSNVKTPICILSGLAGIEDKVRGLGFGADDYMTKPFHKDELIARIHAIVRRSKGHAQSVITTGALTVNFDTKTAAMKQEDGTDEKIPLTGKEYQMLELLSLRKGTTLTKEMFLNHIYGGMDEPQIKLIDVFICKLRKKLSKASGGINFIETVWGRGYVLRGDDEIMPSFNANAVSTSTHKNGSSPEIKEDISEIDAFKETVTHDIVTHGNFRWNKTTQHMSAGTGENKTMLTMNERIIIASMLETPSAFVQYKHLATQKAKIDGTTPNQAAMGQYVRKLAKKLTRIDSSLRIQDRRGEARIISADEMQNKKSIVTAINLPAPVPVQNDVSVCFKSIPSISGHVNGTHTSLVPSLTNAKMPSFLTATQSSFGGFSGIENLIVASTPINENNGQQNTVDTLQHDGDNHYRFNGASVTIEKKILALTAQYVCHHNRGDLSTIDHSALRQYLKENDGVGFNRDESTLKTYLREIKTLCGITPQRRHSKSLSPKIS